MNPITPSDACYALLKEFEQGPGGGFAATPYRCPAGHQTVGWGHKVRSHEKLTYPLSAEHADDLLIADVVEFVRYVVRGVRVPVHQCMFDALVSLCFNIGGGAFLSSTLRYQLNAGGYRAAADQFLRWDKATNPNTGQKESLAGLTRRREAERALFLRDGLPGSP